MTVVKRQIVYAALDGIDRAIDRLSHPQGTTQVIDPGHALGQPTPIIHPLQRPHGTYDMRVMGLDNYERTRRTYGPR